MDGVHRLLNLEVSAQRLRAMPVAAQKMGVSGSPCKQRAFWRRGCDIFCWWPDPRVAVWAGSPHWGPLLGRLWRGEHRPEKKMVLPSAWLLRTVVAVVGRAAYRGAVAWAALLWGPPQPPSVLVRLWRRHPELLRLLTRRRSGLGARPSSRAHHTQGSVRVPPAFQHGSAHRTPWRLPRL